MKFYFLGRDGNSINPNEGDKEFKTKLVEYVVHEEGRRKRNMY